MYQCGYFVNYILHKVIKLIEKAETTKRWKAETYCRCWQLS